MDRLTYPRFRTTLDVSEIVVDGKRKLLLYDSSTDEEVRLGPLEYETARLFDGRRSAEAVAAVLRERVAVGTAQVERLCARLLDLRILEATDGRAAAERTNPFTGRPLRGPVERLLVVTLFEIRGDGWVRWLLARCPWLGASTMVIAGGVLVLAAGVVAAINSTRLWADLAALPIRAWSFWLRMLICGLATSALHEAAHAVACRAQGVRVLSIGWAWHYATIAAWARPGREWRALSRGGRWMTVLAGPLMSFAAAAAGLIAWQFADAAWWRDTWLIVAIGALFGGVLTLVPLHGGDGFALVADALGIDNLRARAFGALTSVVRMRPAPTPHRWRYALFGLGMVVWRLAVAALAVVCLWLMPIPGRAWIGIAAIAAILMIAGVAGKSRR